jgi:hypothetical protein
MYRTSSSNPTSNNVQADTDPLNNKQHPESVDDNPPTMNKRSASNAEWKKWQDNKPAMKGLSEWVSETDNKVIALPLPQALPVAQPVRNLLTDIVHYTTSSTSSLSTSTTNTSITSTSSVSTSTTTSSYSISSHSTPILTTSILSAPVSKKIAPQKNRSQTFTTSVQEAVKPPMLNATPQELYQFISTSTDKQFKDFLILPTAMQLLSSTNSAGQTVLHLAAEKNQSQVIERLLMHPRAVELALARDKAGSTPLIMAAEFGHGDAVKALLDHESAKVQVMAITMYGDNALMTAVSAGHLDIVKLLLNAGWAKEQINRVNSAGSSVISLAIQQRHESTEVLLKLFKRF